MLVRKDPTSGQVELFRTRLENLIDDRHELVQLAAKLDWEMFDEKFGTMFSEGSGRPGAANAAHGWASISKVPVL